MIIPTPKHYLTPEGRRAVQERAAQLRQALAERRAERDLLSAYQRLTNR